MDFCMLGSSECRVLAASLLGGGLGRVGADLGRVVCAALAGPAAAGFLGGPALPNGEEDLAARAEAAVGLGAAAAFPLIRFGAILDHDLTAGLQRSDPVSRTPQVSFVVKQLKGVSCDHTIATLRPKTRDSTCQSTSHLLRHTNDMRTIDRSTQRAAATRSLRAEVKLDPCTQLSEAGS